MASFSSISLLFILLCSVANQIWLCEAGFVFYLKLHSITSKMVCDFGVYSECEAYLSIFCLREGRSTNSTSISDCPLGTNGRRVSVDDISSSTSHVTRKISSLKSWPVR